MGQINYIKEKGKDIIHSDLRNTKDTEMVKIIDDETERILERNEKFRIIVDVSDSFTTPKFMKSAYDFAGSTKPLMLKGAILGIRGVKKVLLRGYNRFAAPHIMEPFETMEEAIAYVTGD
ncbi:MAG: hypothetical protein JXR07_18200 [Reichenbachiella sp.]